MVLVDANVLIYAVNESAPQHASAKRWLEEALNGDEPVAFAWIALLAFIRITTIGAISPNPLSPDEASGIVADWLAAPAATIAAPTSRHFEILSGLIVEAGTAGNLVTDAHLASLAIEHRARICTYDRDFSRFAGVDVEVPE